MTLVVTAKTFQDIKISGYTIDGARRSANSGKKYKQKYFRYFYEGEEPL